MQIRRVVGKRAGDKAVFTSDGHAPRAFVAKHWKGNQAALIWSTKSGGTQSAADDTEAASWYPEPGGTRFMVVDLPPDAVFAEPGFDGQKMGQEQAEQLVGLGERFDATGMHETDTVDYGIVLDGEIWLELAGGETKHIRQGEVVVQTGARHAWRNKSSRVTRLAFVLIGAPRA